MQSVKRLLAVCGPFWKVQGEETSRAGVAIRLLGAVFAVAALLSTPQVESAGAPVGVPIIRLADDTSARFVQNKNDIAIIEVSGNYNRFASDGSENFGARALVAKEFLRTHPDAYDMLVVFTGFPIDTGTFTAFHHAVKNDIQGIGRPQFDNTAAYGSAGQLRGFIDMAALAKYRTNPLDREFDQLLGVFAHEFLHQFAAYVNYRKPDGTRSADLLGSDGVHWSYLLDTNGSLLYGSRWKDNGDGTFTSNLVRDAYSPLDLYLMGLRRKEDVPPFSIIDAPGVDGTQLPLLGAKVTGVRRQITIDDVIAIEGPRVPDASQSQKNWRIAFIYAVRPGQTVTDAELASLTNIRRTLGTRFNALTDGALNLNILAEPPFTGSTGSPAGLPVPATSFATNVNLPQALTWLRQRQQTGGQWQDTSATAVRDTAVVLRVLDQVDPSFIGGRNGLTWLDSVTPANTDFITRKLVTVAQLTRATGSGSPPASLLAAQNEDGGWGAASGYVSNPLDTALALQALSRFALPADKTIATRGVSYLLDRQNADGGWGNVASAISRTTVTAQVINALGSEASAVSAIGRAKTFLASRQNPDGGFGDSPSSIHDTAHVVQSLMSANATAAVDLGKALQYLSAAQRVDGSWAGSVYSTALAADVLARSNAMNWAVTGFAANPSRAIDGQRVTLSVTLRNTGNRESPKSVLRVFDGDPAAGGVSIGADAEVPVIAPGTNATVSLVWNTLGKQGNRTLHAVVDPDRTQQELSIADNTATLPVVIDAPAAGLDLLLDASDISASPAKPSTLPAAITISALLTNAGTQEAANVKVVLWQGTGAQRTQVGSTLIASFVGRSTRPVSFPLTFNDPAGATYTIEIDPDNSLVETSRGNNSASIAVTPAPNLDLEVQSDDITLDKSAPRKGDDLNFTVKLRNRGTADSPDVIVRYSVSGSAGSADIVSNVVRIKAGQVITQQVPWRATLSGALKFKASIDPASAVDEALRANNQAEYAFTVVESSGPSLAVSFRDLTTEPAIGLEGYPIKINALVRNVGDQGASNVEVAFYVGDPAAGGVRISDLQIIPSLAAGASQALSVTWPEIPDAVSKTFHVVIDPDSKITGDVIREDNRAFFTVQVRSLPDLAISAGNLTLTPSLPQPGQAVALNVRVDNLGEQAATNVLVRVYDGDPANGGAQVGGDKIINSIGPSSSGTVSFDWSFPSVAGARTLHVVADPLLSIKEKKRDNNRALIEVGVQSGDFTVTNAFISPNGDGVQDTSEFSFRLLGMQTVTLRVLNDAGTMVREIGGAWNNVSSGRWTWDGKNNTGTVVPDGVYQISVLSSSQATLGQAQVVVDNNRLPWLAAAENDRLMKAGLTCQVGIAEMVQEFSVNQIGKRAFFKVGSSQGANVPGGLYTIDGWGNGLQQLAPEPDNNATSTYWDGLLPAGESGGAYATLSKSGNSGRISTSLWWISPLDQQPVELEFDTGNTGSYFELVGTSQSGDEVYLTEFAGGTVRLLAVPRSTPAQFRQLTVANVEVGVFSPDRTMLYALAQDGNGSTPILLNMKTGSRVVLPSGLDNPVWSPDGQLLALVRREPFSFEVFNLDGAKVRDSALGSGLLPAVVESLGPSPSAWSPDGRAVLVAMNGNCQQKNCTKARIFKLDIATGQVSLLAEEATAGVDQGGELAGWFESPRFSLHAMPGQSSLLLYSGGTAGSLSAFGLNQQTGFSETAGWFELDAESGAQRPVAQRVHPVLRPLLGHGNDLVSQFDKREGFRDQGRSFVGRNLSGQPPNCSQANENDWVLSRSADNLAADLRIERAATHFILSGTAADKNFQRYSLEYSNTATPGVWLPVAPTSTVPVLAGEMARWTPPAEGTYLVRLSVEDRAGNTQQQQLQVRWGARALLTDVWRSPEYISPNADGVQDVAVIHYRVSEPVNIEFTVFNDKGDRVRRFTRSHPAAGVVQELEWNGLDDSGVRVPDGSYRINFLDFEFSIKVDSTSPVPSTEVRNRLNKIARLEFSLNPVLLDFAYEAGESPPAPKEFRPHVRLDWAAFDANFRNVLVQSKPLEGGEWTTVTESNIPNIRRPYAPVIIPLDQVSANRYRVLISDLAGNAVSEELPLLEQFVKATGFAFIPPSTSFEGLAESTFIPLSGLLSSDEGVALEVVETLRKPIAQYWIEYQRKGPSGFGPNWVSSAITSRTPADSVLPAGRRATKGSFQFKWKPEGMVPGEAYWARIRLVDADGASTTSVPFSVVDTDQYQLSADMDSNGLQATIAFNIQKPYAKLELGLSSPTDARFAIEQIIWTRPGGPAVPLQDTISAIYSNSLQACASYKLSLWLTPMDASQPRTVVASTNLQNCVHVSTEVRPELAQCGATPAGILNLRFKARKRIADDIPLVLLEFGRTRNDGTDDILYSKINPVLETGYDFQLSTASLAEGAYPQTYFSRIKDAQGAVRQKFVNFAVDRTPPVAQLTAPLQLAKVCARYESQGGGVSRSFVDLEGRITDQAGFDYVLQVGAGEQPTSWSEIPTSAPSCIGAENRTRLLGEINPQTSGAIQYLRAVPPPPPALQPCGEFTELAGSDRAGLMARLYDKHGLQTVRLHARDWGGHQVCREVTFDVDSKVAVEPARLSRTQIRPGAAGDAGSVAVLTQAGEVVLLNMKVYRRDDVTLTPAGELSSINPGAVAVKTLAADKSHPIGELTSNWEGKSDAGAIVAEGTYVIVTTYVDDCGNQAGDRPLLVRVDQQGPEVALVEPAENAEVSGIVNVVGTVRDANLARWELSVGEGAAPASWLPLATGAREASNARLATWSTLGLAPGDHTLRLMAEDTAGNQAEVTRKVNVVAAGDVLEYLESTTSLFSPNGDGKLDSLGLRFGLKQAANVTLRVMNGSTVVRTLLNAVSRGPGSASLTWDGKSDSGDALPDATYLIRIEATNLSGVTQSADLSIALDTTAPVIVTAEPISGYARSVGNLVGSISDVHLSEYQVTARRTDTGATVQLASGTVSVMDAVLASLATLTEGPHELVINAVDQAQNSMQLKLAVEIDNLAPVVALTSPTQDAHIGSKPGVLALSGTVVEKNLKSYSLHLVPLVPAGSSVTLHTSSNPDIPAVLHNLDTSSLADGRYRLELKAEDKAGGLGLASVEFVVDKRAPLATITVPAEDAFIKTGVEVRGTASDDNFALFKLEIAPGAKAAATRFSELLQGGSAVIDGILGKLTALPADGVHTLRLTVIDKAGNSGTALVQVSVDTTPPAAPTNLVAKSEGRQDVALSWTAVADPTLQGYAIYRDGQRINPSLVTETRHLDAGVAEGDHRYEVSAVDRAGNEGARSAAANIRISLALPTAQISAPQTNSTVGGTVEIRGTAWSARDFKEYRLSVGEGVAPAQLAMLRRSTIPAQSELLGSWNTAGLLEGAIYTVRLDVEDTLGNSAQQSIALRVDNQPPARPVGLIANAAGSDVTLSWSANPESDLAGYLLYRGDRLVNQVGATPGDLAGHLIKATSWVDRQVPDGTHDYTLVAVDLAGNLSQATAPVRIVLDTRDPRAVIEKPVNGAKVDKNVYVLATSSDSDIASVQLEFRVAGAGAWVALGSPILKAPYGANWDLSALALGDYELRAVARDNGGRVDPAPATILVTHARLERPSPPLGLRLKLNGGEAQLDWTPASPETGIRYFVERAVGGADAASDFVRLNSAALSTATHVDSNLSDGEYSYRVIAVDAADAESDASAVVSGEVYTPMVEQAMTPTTERKFTLSGKARPGAQVSVMGSGPLGNRAWQPVPDAQFNYVLENIALAPGNNRFEVKESYANGNVSRTALVRMLVGDRPAKTSGLTGTAVGTRAQLTWTPNGEPDIGGYVVKAPDGLLLQSVELSNALATDDSMDLPPSAIIDADYSSVWEPARFRAGVAIEASAASARMISELSVEWAGDPAYIPRAFRIQAWDGEVWVTIANVTNNEEPSFYVQLSTPYLTRKLRVQVWQPGSGGSFQIADLYANELPRTSQSSIALEPLNGKIDFSVSAHSAIGLVGDASEAYRLGVGDSTPPSKVSLTASLEGQDVHLAWSASASADVAYYDIIRNGESISTVSASELTWTDFGRTAGTYRYAVVALDEFGNRSEESNTVTIIVNEDLPAAPLGLEVSAVASGAALNIVWLPATQGTVPADYVLERATQSGGPWVNVVETTGTEHRDAGLTNGVRYYYRVCPRTASGTRGTCSAEASGVPAFSLSLTAPVFSYPSSSQLTAAVTSGFITLAGQATPATTVGIDINGRRVATASAQAVTNAHELGSSQRFVVSQDASALIRSANAGHELVQVVWSANGANLAVVKSFGQELSRDPVWARHAPVALVSTDGLDPVLNTRAQRLLRLDALSGSTEVVSQVNWDSGEYALGPDGGTVFLWGTRDGQSGLYRIDPSTGTAALLNTMNSGWNLRVSPDGSRLAFNTDGGLWWVDSTTGASRRIADANGSMDWAPDSRRLVHVSNVNGAQRVVEYDLSTETTRALTADLPYVEDPVLSPDGTRLAYLDGQLRIVTLSTGEMLEDDALQGNYTSLRWLPSGCLVGAGYGSTRCITLPGHFRADLIALQAGDNTVTGAVSRAGVGSGPSSAPVVVRYTTANRPDISISAADLTLLPTLPAVNETARLTLIVRNVGPVAAAGSSLQISVQEPGGGVRTLTDLSVPALASGGSFQHALDWTPTLVGTHRIVAVADRLNVIAEVSETNNSLVREVTVTQGATASLEVSTDARVYATGSSIRIQAKVGNGGATLSGNLEFSIEDAQGFVVANLTAEPIQALSFGQVLNVARTWPSASTLPGDYRARVRLRSGSSVLAETSAAFTLEAPINLTVTLTSDRSEYSQSAPVNLSSRVRFASGSGLGRNGDILFRVLDSQGLVRYENQRPLPLGTDADLSAIWNASDKSPGDYSATVAVRLNGQELAGASVAFKVVAPVLSPPLVSLVEPAPNAVFSAPASINISVGASSPNASGSVVKVEYFANGNRLGETTAAPHLFRWTDVAAGQYQIFARATDNRGVANDSVSANVRVNALPTAEITAPVAGTSFTAPARITINARGADSDGSITKVEVFAGSLKLGECAASPCEVVWNAAPVGGHNLSARVTDNLGGVTQSAAVPIAVGQASIPPAVAILTPAANAVVNLPGSFALTASATAGTQGATIARVEYFQGTVKLGEATQTPYLVEWAPTAAGAFSLTARATDSNGSFTDSAPVVVVANARPVVDITAPLSGAIQHAPASFAITVQASDADGSISLVEVFADAMQIGQCNTSPCSVAWNQVLAGSYVLTARATDNRGAVSQSLPVSVIANALPVVAINAPADGAIFTAPAQVNAVIAGSDSDGSIALIELLLDGVKAGECASATCSIVLANVPAGGHTLAARATDDRGGVSTSAVVNVVVNAPARPPVITLDVPVAQTLYQAPATVMLQANASSPDAGVTISRVEFFAGSTRLGEVTTAPWSFGWTAVPAGQYVLKARATDSRGLTSETTGTAILVNAQPTVSISAPLANANYLAPASISILAQAADADGNISKVEIYEGANKLAECAAVPCAFNWVGVSAGSYALSARVTDDRAGSGVSSAVNIIVSAAQPPTVSLTAPADQSVYQARSTITLNATAASTNPGGSIAKVEFYQGSTKLGEATQAPYSFTWPAVDAGSYVLKARAINERGLSADSPAAFVIVNAQPTVTITAPANNASYTVPAQIGITATAADSDGTISRIELFRDGVKLSECATSPCSFTWTNAPAGEYSLTAKATDNRSGVATSAVVNVKVQAAQAPVVALTAPANGTVFQAPASILLAATASSPNTGGSIARVEFYQGTTKLGEATQAPYSFTWAGVNAGNYSVRARAIDNNGISTDSSVVTVNVNAQPTVTITAPANNASYTAPAQVNITATASDSDGSLTRIELFRDGVKLSECAASPCSFTWTGVTSGTYVITAKATDNRGGSTTSAAVTVKVQSAQAPVVALTAPAAGAVYQAPAGITLGATASSPNAGGRIAKVEFFQGTTKLGEATQAPYSFNWTNVAAGNYSLRARATDNAGVTTDSAAVSVIVNARPQVTLTAPTANSRYLAPATVSLNATASDADGSITKLELLQGTQVLKECAATPCSFSWTNVVAGTYSLTARATDNRGGVTTSAPVSITVATLTGSVSLTPSPAQPGDTLQITTQVTSPVALTNATLRVKITHSDGTTVITDQSKTQTLAAGTPVTWAFTAATAGKPAGTYTAIFSLKNGTTETTIAQASLILRGLATVKLSLAQSAAANVLVLAGCVVSESDDSDSSDAACAEQRRAYLESKLRDLGITARVVSDVDTFRSELRCGTWNVVWLAGGVPKLKDELIPEIGQHLAAGKGLLVDGIHDDRNEDLDDLLGVEADGKLSNNRSYSLVAATDPLSTAAITVAGRAIKLEIEDDDDDSFRGPSVIHARFNNSDRDPAIVSTLYGAGRALVAGFDLVATLQSQPAADALLKAMISRAAPVLVAPGSRASVQVTVTNTGSAGDANIQLSLPAALVLQDASPQPTSGSSWLLQLAQGETRIINLGLSAPATAGTFPIQVSATQTPVASASLSVVVGNLSGGTHDAVAAAFNALSLSSSDRSDRDKAVQRINESKALLSSSPEEALYKLLDAADEASDIDGTNAFAARIQLARLTVSLGGTWCQQMPVCVRPNGGVPPLSSYQVLVFGNAQFSNGSAEGSIGVGGNAQLSGYTVASQLRGDMARLFAGGNITFSSGSVGVGGSGIIVAGGNLNVSQNVGRRKAEDDEDTEEWNSLRARFRSLSLALQGGSAGTADGFGKLTLRGTNVTYNVFSITGTQLGATRTLVFDVPISSTVVVNVTGGSASFSNGSQFVLEGGQQKSMQGHALATRTLFNFPTASQVSVSGFAVQGSLLAPVSNVTYSNSNLFGQLFASSLTTSGAGLQQCGSFRGSLPQ